MIYWLLYIAFVVLASSMLLWGLLKKDRMFQYPTIAGASWLILFGIQALGAVRNPAKYPQAVLADGGLAIALMMLSLCVAAGWLGYRQARKSGRALRFPELSDEKLFWVGLALYGIGFCAAYKLARVTGGGFVEQFTGGGHYGAAWEGETVRYAFFSKLIYPGFLLVWLSTLRRFSYMKLCVTIVMALYPMAVIIFLGRRTKAVILGLIIVLGLVFARRVTVPRWIFMALLFAALLAVYYGPAYRSASQYGLNYTDIATSIAASDDLLAAAEGQRPCEFDVLVIGGAAVNHDLAFDYGVGVYNGLVSSFVPHQLVGAQLKRSLMIDLQGEPVYARTSRLYQWQLPYGSFPTGPFTAFRQFWFFGCVWYYVSGFLFGLFWGAAYERRNPVAQLWYISCVVMIPLSIAASVVYIVTTSIGTFILLWFVMRLCGRGPMRQFRRVWPCRTNRARRSSTCALTSASP